MEQENKSYEMLGKFLDYYSKMFLMSNEVCMIIDGEEEIGMSSIGFKAEKCMK